MYMTGRGNGIFKLLSQLHFSSHVWYSFRRIIRLSLLEYTWLSLAMRRASITKQALTLVVKHNLTPVNSQDLRSEKRNL
ncbi:hypothetical protein PM082_011134 [Marasmius tenuissimus]|nr:hypothetical protein PM082_011134 [Marasmius tenuissimus]